VKEHEPLRSDAPVLGVVVVVVAAAVAVAQYRSERGILRPLAVVDARML